MSYPLINGTVINGASTGVQQTQGLQPVRFGSPVLRLHFPAASLNAAPAFGAPQLAVPRPASLVPMSFGVHRIGFQGRSFLAGRFGMPVLTVSMQVADGVAGVIFGVPELKVGTDYAPTPPSIQPVRFGDASLRAGMPPNSTMLGVASLRQAAFGKPAVSAVLVLRGLAPLQPVGFGHAVMRARLTAKGLAVTTMGTPGQVAHFQPQPLRFMAFGGPCMAIGLPAASTAKVRFGRPRVALATAVLGADSLEPVRFSTIAMTGISLRARTLTAVRFGRPFVSGDSTC